MNKDFTEEDLQISRYENANYIFKRRAKELIVPSLIMFIFSVLFFGYVILNRITLINSGYNIKTYFLTYSFPMIAMILVYSVPLSGMLYVLRRKLYLETSVTAYFFKGINENFVEVASFSVIYYMLYALLDLLEKYIRVSLPSLSIVTFILTRLIMVILLLFYFYTLTSAIMYKNSFVLIIKDTITNAFKSNKTYILLIISLCIIPISLYGSISALYISIVFMVIISIFFVFICLFVLSITCDTYDFNINKELYPEFYNKGVNHD